MKLKLKNWRMLLLCSLLAALLLGATLAGEKIERSLISSGGGTISGSGVMLQDAVAQPVSGVVISADGKLVLCSGYVCGRTVGNWLFLPMLRH